MAHLWLPDHAHGKRIAGRAILSAGCTFVVLSSASFAAGIIVSSSLDGGGLRATNANYTMDGSLGGIGGVSSNVSPPEIMKSGYIGQLTEVTNLNVNASPGATNEGCVLQLAGLARLDDATVSVLAGSNILWAAPGFPIVSITPLGAATTTNVWSNTWGSVSGSYLGVSGSGLVLVLDSDSDNYGSYAGDGIPDGWQVQYFGLNNPLGKPDATNCTGQCNRYTYTADLNPNDPASVFEVVAISNQPPNQVVYFKTASAGRIYRLLYAADLVGGVWTNLPDTTWAPGVAGQMSLCDTNAPAIRFYRVQVQVP